VEAFHGQPTEAGTGTDRIAGDNAGLWRDGATGAPRARDTTEAQAETILNAVLDAGINYIDTSIDYGVSEERIGRYIRTVARVLPGKQMRLSGRSSGRARQRACTCSPATTSSPVSSRA
jgi:aryl-alcohol dehydrogenase-like predicted oxidoreductase